MKTRFVAAASLLAVCIAAASTGAQAQPASPQAEQLRLQLAGYRDQRSALVQRIAEVEQRIASLRGTQKTARLKAAWAERAQLRAELNAMDATIRVMAMLQKNGGQAGAATLQSTQAELERKVANTTVALRLAREELEAARVGVSELSVEQATQAMQLAARQYRSALLVSEAFVKNREQIDDAVAVAQSAAGPAGFPKKTDSGAGVTATDSPGKSRKPGAVIEDPVATTEPVTASVIDAMQAIAADSPEPPPPEPEVVAEPVAVVQTEPAAQPAPETVVAPEPQPEPIAAVEPAPAPETQAEPAPVVSPEPIVAAEPEPAPAPADAPAPAPEIADAGAPPAPAAEPAPVVVPEEPPISEAEVDDLLAAAPPPSAPPADEPVSEPAQPAPPADDPVAAIEPDPIVQEPDPVAPPPPADDPIAVADPPPTVQDPIVEPAPQPEQPAPVVVTGVATLSWSAPMTRANGAPLSMAELSGYEIYVVAESTGESSVITVSDPTALNYTVGNLAPDTYHFAISAVDTENHVSDMSPIVSKTIADVSVASAP